MSKRFPEYSGLNLPEINDSVLEKWSAEDVFARTMSEREGCPSFVFLKVLLPPTESRAYTMCLPAL